MQRPPLSAPWMPPDSAKTNGTSVFALVASLSGFVCFMGVGGALGIVLGLIARSEIKKADGREGGRGLASAAIAIGALNVVLAVVSVGVGITYLVKESHAARSHALGAPPTAPAPAPTWAAPGGVPRAAKRPRPRAPEARVSREAGTRVTTLGSITLADLSGDFDAELSKQRALADTAGETLVLWLVVRDCKPCDGVAAALTTPVSQKALAKIRFVRVDREEFQVELDGLGVPTEKIPGFALLDNRNHLRDFIHGGEWDADIASNIAPVLGKFAHGAYSARRYPWRGAPRDDETPI